MIFAECLKCGCRYLWGLSFPCLCQNTIEQIRRIGTERFGEQNIYLPGEKFKDDELALAQRYSRLSYFSDERGAR